MKTPLIWDHVRGDEVGCFPGKDFSRPGGGFQFRGEFPVLRVEEHHLGSQELVLPLEVVEGPGRLVIQPPPGDPVADFLHAFLKGEEGTEKGDAKRVRDPGRREHQDQGTDEKRQYRRTRLHFPLSL